MSRSARAVRRLVHLRAALVACSVVACSAMAACSSSTAEPPDGRSADGAPELEVYAAASLRDVVTELAATYESERGVRLVLAFGGSATLRAQIEQGAPADLFLSADERNAGALVAAGDATGPPVAVADNGVTIVTPTDARQHIAHPFDLARPGVRIIAAFAETPITRYADAMLARLARLPGAPPAFVDRVEDNVVSREDDVRAVLARIELGEGDAAIVYRTDARAPQRIREVAIPEEAEVAARYFGVVTAPREREAAARALLTWLSGPEARATFEAHGFAPTTP